MNNNNARVNANVNTHNQNSSVSIPRMIGLNGIKVKAVAAGWAHSLILTNTGQVYSWGYGEDGQLGLGQFKNIDTPTLIPTQSPISTIYAGHSHSGFIDTHFNYYSFGYNKDLRLMLTPISSTATHVNVPTKVKLQRVVKAALGITHTCLLTA